MGSLIGQRIQPMNLGNNCTNQAYTLPRMVLFQPVSDIRAQAMLSRRTAASVNIEYVHSLQVESTDREHIPNVSTQNVFTSTAEFLTGGNGCWLRPHTSTQRSEPHKHCCSQAKGCRKAICGVLLLLPRLVRYNDLWFGTCNAR